jgi:hypothetical protein
MKKFFIISFFLFSLTLFSQAQKSIPAVRTNLPIKIDGLPNDEAWKEAPIAKDFVMMDPGSGTPEPKDYQSIVKVLYDDTNLYILAILKDPNPQNIAKEFGLRDQFTQADWFSLMINPFFSPKNTYLFGVTAAGAQLDGIQKDNTDFSWNAVWKSNISFTKDAWIVEMAIPYSALRFQNEKIQNWGITFVRFITKKRETYTWTFFDKKKQGDVVQFLGVLKGLKDLKPPVRLSLFPYVSMVHTKKETENTTGYGYGMDLKYGLSESYTLDATLIPDFSDTPYDDLRLSLGPFEQYYAEKRQFFTEGMTLFNKGNLFYSRRIGNTPVDYYKPYSELKPNEEIIDNPDKTQLINAIKISGRSKNGLGVGFFNAVTNNAEAKILDTITGLGREIVTEPLANYNMLVLDYNFNKSSSVSFVNTNVIRKGSARDANVTGLVYDLFFQNNTLNLSGTTALSMINDDTFEKGFKFNTALSKKINEHSFEASLRMQDDKFDNNDMGFNRVNNFAKFDVSYSYSILEPTKHFVNKRISFDVGFDRRYSPFSMIRNDASLSIFFTNKKYLSYGLNLEYTTDEYDYYEPRQEGRFYLNGAFGGGNVFFSSDYRKKLAMDLHFSRFKKVTGDQNFYGFRFSPRFRISNHLKMIYSLDYKKMNNFKGYVNADDNYIYFGNRDQKILEQKLSGNYYFNTKSGLNLSFRYYWSPVHYDKFYVLKQDGTLGDSSYTGNHDINFNIWNLDLSYVWEFAPGSQLSLLYRNIITNSDDMAQLDYRTNIDNLFAQPKTHSFVMKVTYYIDYNNVKNKWF